MFLINQVPRFFFPYLNLVYHFLTKNYRIIVGSDYRLIVSGYYILMYSKNVTVIVPRLPPSVDGLGDYGLILARQMRHDFGITTEFIVADPDWNGETLIEEFKVKKLKERSASALYECLTSADTVLLHYVGYGYAKRGCPVWLVSALSTWHNSSHEKKLITMFHELFAFGPIWTSQFWTSPIQRWLVFRLSRLSDHCLTSKNTYASILKSYSANRHTIIDVLPVFSNVGELGKPSDLDARKKNLVVFGSAGLRSRVYKESHNELKRTIREMNIEKVIDIGTPLPFKIEPLDDVEIQVMGNLPGDLVSEILSDSIVGFFNYPPGYLAKSGVFASYCSHGVIPIGHWKSSQISDGVEEKVHFWLVDRYGQKMNLKDGQVAANNAFTWYQGHRLSVQAKKFADFLV